MITLAKAASKFKLLSLNKSRPDSPKQSSLYLSDSSSDDEEDYDDDEDDDDFGMIENYNRILSNFTPDDIYDYILDFDDDDFIADGPGEKNF